MEYIQKGLRKYIRKYKTAIRCKIMTQNELCRNIDSRYEVINKWYNGAAEKIDADVLARMCYVLECKPEDIIHIKLISKININIIQKK